MKRLICLVLVVIMVVIGLEMYKARQQQQLTGLKERIFELQKQNSCHLH